MRADITSLPNTPSWRGAQLKNSIGTTLPLFHFLVKGQNKQTNKHLAYL
jgi:hypothetical protein